MLILNMLLAAVTYLSPVRFEVLLAGNFGEPRPNHFHAGLDIKTDQVEGKPIHAIGDGYVSHVSVNKGGTGYCIHVRHPEGYTSVYGHLQKFSPIIEAVVKRKQYREHQCDVEVDLNATDCPVRKGQVIALSGDTGASEGPHLHLEIHQTDNWKLIDPLEMIPDLLNDTVPPVAHAFMAYPVKGSGVFCGEAEKRRVDFVGDSITERLTAWGKVGFALNAADFMQGSSNRCGVRFTTLLVDSVEVFSCDMNNVPPSMHKLVNLWGDYDYYDKNGEWFLKSFIHPSNRLPMLKADKNKGIVNFDKEKDYHLTYVLSDFFGNKSEYHFIITGSPHHTDSLQQVPQKTEKDDSLVVSARSENVIKMEGGVMTIPKEGLLSDDCKVKPLAKHARNGYSDAFRFSDKALPLDKEIEVRIKLNRLPDDPTKIFLASHHKNHDGFLPAQVDDGWLTAKVNSAHMFLQAAYDDKPPQVNVAFDSEKDSIPLVTITATDALSGIDKIEGYVDNEFILFERVNKTNKMTCNLTKTPVRPKGEERQLTVVATDFCGNESRQSMMIKY